MCVTKKILALATISVLFCACDDGGGGKSQQVQIPDPPAAPVVTVSADTKQLIFSWEAVATATHYRLLENPDGHSGFTQVGGNTPGIETSVARDIAVHLHDWVDALYVVQACNTGGCTDSVQVSSFDAMLDAIGYVKASSPSSGDEFGYAIAMSSDATTLAIAAPWKHSQISEPDAAHPSGQCCVDFGGVYIYQRSNNGWVQEAIVEPTVMDHFQYFGRSLDLSADGKTLAVNSVGFVYVFGNGESGWAERGRLERDWVGRGEVALSADGRTLVVGAPEDRVPIGSCDAGSVYVFRLVGEEWVETAYFRGSNTEGAPCEPSYKRPNGDLFGQALALNAAGDLLVVAAPAEASRALGIDGDQYDDEDDSYRGAAYVFRFNGGAWIQEAYIKPSSLSRAFGDSVALDAAGNVLIVTTQHDDATEKGRIYVFGFDGNAWREESFLAVYPKSIAINATGDYLVIGAPGEDGMATGINGDASLTGGESYNAGAVFAFAVQNGDLSETAYIKSPHHDEGDLFGRAVALSGDSETLAVSALGEDSATSGNLLDNSVPDSGAGYVY